ncbi:MAG: hypothetical protein OEZ01_14910, partial [Candidatus Heimdallarchaeota archaeon]|nr:hypothetical protein [Candidatus Heimdallarchaeota archaeon]
QLTINLIDDSNQFNLNLYQDLYDNIESNIEFYLLSPRKFLTLSIIKACLQVILGNTNSISETLEMAKEAGIPDWSEDHIIALEYTYIKELITKSDFPDNVSDANEFIVKFPRHDYLNPFDYNSFYLPTFILPNKKKLIIGNFACSIDKLQD